MRRLRRLKRGYSWNPLGTLDPLETKGNLDRGDDVREIFVGPSWDLRGIFVGPSWDLRGTFTWTWQ